MRASVSRAQRTAQPAGRFAQGLVAGGMPQAVVDGLESVEVEHEQGHRRAAGGRRQAAHELQVQAAAVEQAGERIVQGLAPHRLLALARPCGIAHHGDQQAAVVRAASQGQVHVQCVPVAVLQPDAAGPARGDRAFPGAELALQQGVQARLEGRRHQHGHGLPDQFAGRVAGDGGQRVVDQPDAAAAVHRHDAIGNAIEYCARQRAVRGGRRFGPQRMQGGGVMEVRCGLHGAAAGLVRCAGRVLAMPAV
nr:hypothetical protein [Xylophilus sp.]